MKFAAGLTVTGVISFLLLEALKILMPTLVAWLTAFILLALKLLLLAFGLFAIVAAAGVGFYVWKRTRRGHEAA